VTVVEAVLEVGEDEEVVEEAVEDDCMGAGDDDVESPKVALSILSSSQSSADLISVEIITPPLSAVACGARVSDRQAIGQRCGPVYLGGE
jgi:hypothetical protein